MVLPLQHNCLNRSKKSRTDYNCKLLAPDTRSKPGIIIIDEKCLKQDTTNTVDNNCYVESHTVIILKIVSSLTSFHAEENKIEKLANKN